MNLKLKMSISLKDTIYIVGLCKIHTFEVRHKRSFPYSEVG